jgi:hypothetical protein
MENNEWGGGIIDTRKGIGNLMLPFSSVGKESMIPTYC